MSQKFILKKKAISRAEKKDTAKNREREQNILTSALKIFGEKGFENTTISEISKTAKISDATIYEYFSSKEEILFSIAHKYTLKEFERMKQIAPYVHGAPARIRMIIQAYLEFYEQNKEYTSVALLTLKSNRNFIQSEAYQIVREVSGTIVAIYKEGIEEGVFREDMDPYLVRNMVLGFIEHLTVQWLLVGRPEKISEYRDTIFEMVMRTVLKDPKIFQTLL
jgi:AcrR family transcriptional regulator